MKKRGREREKEKEEENPSTKFIDIKFFGLNQLFDLFTFAYFQEKKRDKRKRKKRNKEIKKRPSEAAVWISVSFFSPEETEREDIFLLFLGERERKEKLEKKV